MAETKTGPTGASVAEFLDAVEPAGRREDGLVLRELFDRVTDTDAVMWGPSIVGYGLQHYTYASGREGDWPIVGFSPRKANVSLYGLQLPGGEELVERLGKVKLGVDCIWVGRLSNIDLDVLVSLIDRSWIHARG
ncbi:hypothetical protein SAMN05428970_3627 [Agromyces sp. CF514]|uniref:DUF1801 domain-containing protein n=1 Tax=Agromyces sp. CF514 TaxID=1881031 RepID=UPI0008E033EE|nr:DUF1801 domain-containing protein [Agromyces sp. CF514]SFR88875.1 hypothetical protein SAMN05428970_3627 [Agromyces sp. CF514]